METLELKIACLSKIVGDKITSGEKKFFFSFFKIKKDKSVFFIKKVIK